MVRYCTAPECNTYGTEQGVSFHYYPKDVKLRKKWFIVLRQGKDQPDHAMICSKHFKESDFLVSLHPAKHGSTPRRRLKRGAVPSKNLPSRPHDRILKPRTTHTSLNAGTIAEVNSADVETTKCHEDVPRGLSAAPVPETEQLNELLLPNDAHRTADLRQESFSTTAHTSTEDCIALLTEELSQFKKDIGTQASTVDLTAQLPHICVAKLKTEQELLALTGISTFQLFYNITSLFSDMRLSISTRSLCLSDEDVVLLTFMKLYHNISYSLLSVLFNIHRTTVSGLCSHALQILAVVLREAIVWPEKDIIQKNLTTYFQEHRDTRVILDCTEVEIQRPQDLTSRILSYSNYKKTYTAKVLIGETPGGLISFLSKAYGGRASDVHITKDSGVIGLCSQVVDTVMVDRGFLIDDLCTAANVKIVRPPFLRGKTRYSEAEASDNIAIARARVHVERGIQRMKRFKVLKKINLELLPCVDQVLTVIAGVVNLSKPIFADDKYINR